MGTLNLIEAGIRDAQKGLLSIDGQEIRTIHPLADYHNGDTRLLALRPEMFSLENDDDAQNQLNGQVESINFLGSVVRIQVRIIQSTLFLDIFNNPNLSIPSIGSKVTLNFPPQGILIMGHAQKGVSQEV